MDPEFKRVDPLRRKGPIFGKPRQLLSERCDSLRSKIRRIDAQLADLAKQRHAATAELEANEERLFPNTGRRGRQPAPDGSVQLPPLEHETVRLWGRRLRSVCIALLRKSGPLPLPALHALLHRHGYEVDATHAVKVLADALAYEVDQGRARRIQRGVYAVSDAAAPPKGRHGNPPLLPLAA